MTLNLIDESNSLQQKSLELARLLQEKKKRKDRNKLKDYRPYTKQREFHAAGTVHDERMFMAGNQLGKTTCGSAEIAYHLTGLYPDWWEGRVFDRPVRMWAGSDTAATTRDGVQKHLLGPPSIHDEWGTGMIPGDCIDDWTLGRSVGDGLDNVIIKHVSGGKSYLGFKNYEQGRRKWQSETLDGVWFDEEPPLEIYTEGLTRTQAKGLFSILTFTPLQGASDVVMLFLSEAQLKEMK